MNRTILFTGGSGLLGSEMKKIFPTEYFPSSTEFNITDFEGMDNTILIMNGILGDSIKTLVHMAAFTSPPKIDENPMKAVEVNIIGTANIVKLCQKYGLRLIYISTDYIFNNKNLDLASEEDPVNPINKYGLSKLGGECSVRCYDNSLTIRLSFGKNKFPYPAAYGDQYTSRESVQITAIKLEKVIKKYDLRGIIHIGYDGVRTVYEYALALDKNNINLTKISIYDSKTIIPKNTMLNTDKYKKLFG